MTDPAPCYHLSGSSCVPHKRDAQRLVELPAFSKCLPRPSRVDLLLFQYTKWYMYYRLVDPGGIEGRVTGQQSIAREINGKRASERFTQLTKLSIDRSGDRLNPPQPTCFFSFFFQSNLDTHTPCLLSSSASDFVFRIIHTGCKKPARGHIKPGYSTRDRSIATVARCGIPTVLLIVQYYTKPANMSFDEILDLTANYFFSSCNPTINVQHDLQQ